MTEQYRWEFMGWCGEGDFKRKMAVPRENFGHDLLRATSHTRLRARDRYTSSTLIGGKGGAGPSSLHTTLEGPMEYVDARWM